MSTKGADSIIDSSNELKFGTKPKRPRLDSEKTSPSLSYARTPSEHDTPPESEFKLDRQPLVNHLLKKLSLKVPMEKTKLEVLIASAIASADDELVHEYCKAEPGDTSWKLGLSAIEISRLEPVLSRIRQMQTKKQITLKQILSASLPESDMSDAIEIYDILQNTEPYTEDHLRLRRTLRAILEREIKAPADKLARFDEEEIRLEKLASSTRSDDFRSKIILLDASDAVRALIMSKYRVFTTLDKDSSAYGAMYEWIDWAISLPWNTCIPKLIFDTPAKLREHLCAIREKIDAKIFGLDKIKEKLLSHYCSRLRGGKSAILALKGSAGVGKTSLIRAYAEAINVPFEHISMGGAIDPTLFRGDRASWIGSTPGIFVQVLRKAQVKNCILLLDEVDKVGKASREGDSRASQVEAALLHTTDRTQNFRMKDDFLSGLEIDVSQVDQFFTLNDEESLNPILRDRLEIILISDYKMAQKYTILRNYSLGKICNELNVSGLTLTEKGARAIIAKTSRATGMRTAERALRRIVEKIAMYEATGMKVKTELGDETISFPYTITDTIIDSMYDTEE